MTGLLDAWERFWFAPEPTSTLAVFRITVGLLTLGWAVSLAPDLFGFFSQDGIVPEQPSYGVAAAKGLWGILGFYPSDAAVVALYAALLVASVCVTAGLATRLAAAVLFVALLSFERRAPFVFNGGDQLLRILAFYLALAPSGAALSLDRLLRRRRQFWEFPLRASWVVRLMQVQFSIIYLFAAWPKLRGTTWNDGSAVYYAVRIEDLERFPVPDALTSTAYVSNLLTYGTVAAELSLAFLVWSRRLRPWVLAVGVLLHLSIDYSLRVGFFSYAMLALYIVWIPPERTAAALLALRDRIGWGRRDLDLEVSESP